MCEECQEYEVSEGEIEEVKCVQCGDDIVRWKGHTHHDTCLDCYACEYFEEQDNNLAKGGGE